jgi:hypothetical protein
LVVFSLGMVKVEEGLRGNQGQQQVVNKSRSSIGDGAVKTRTEVGDEGGWCDGGAATRPGSRWVVEEKELGCGAAGRKSDHVVAIAISKTRSLENRRADIPGGVFECGE